MTPECSRRECRHDLQGSSRGFARCKHPRYDRIHATDRVDLIRNASWLGGAPEIADHNAGGTRSELADGLGTIRRSGVQHHLVTVMKKRLHRCPPELPVMKTIAIRCSSHCSAAV
jgi:hypothetical protein